MANLYNIPLKNAVQKQLAATLLTAETGTATFDSSVTAELQASANVPGLFVVDRIDANGTETPSKREYVAFTGVSGSTVTTLSRGLGGSTAQDHAVGAIVEFVPDVVWAQALLDVIQAEHNYQGKHTAIGASSVSTMLLNVGTNIINASTASLPLIYTNKIIASQASIAVMNVTTHLNVSGASLSGGFVTETSVNTLTNKTLTLPVFTGGIISFNAPEGFLINGKIVPSVASNNLTVALKGLDGNDPSASNPVYCRIGGVVRSITAALSVTKNAATNWCNAGSTELATKEVDYFVYLGYNATDGVVIGFSRIPYATLYSDFSATTTNEKYAGISTITNAAAGDDYENIGRFAATLSAGAGYTWSVPTFTASNLIQRPVFETRPLDYTVAHTASGTGYTNAPTTSVAKYIIGRNSLDLFTIFAYNATSGGTGLSKITLPFTPAHNNQAVIAVNGTSTISCVGNYSSGFIFLAKYDGTTPIVNSQTIGVNARLLI